MGDNNLNLPPGFRFYPTDEELVVHFLQRKAQVLPCHPDVIPDLDLSPYDPWDLEGKAMSEGNKWYFYSRRTKRRVTGSGHWQPVGLEEPIYSSHDAQKVGLKKHWEFYVGETKLKTNWVMQEYSLVDSSSNRSSSRRRSSKIDYSKWIVCRVYEVVGSDGGEGDGGAELSCLDEVFLSMDDLDEISLPN